MSFDLFGYHPVLAEYLFYFIILLIGFFIGYFVRDKFVCHCECEVEDD